MKNIIVCILVLLGLFNIACKDVTIGYLVTESAGYDPDTLIVKRVLDLDDREIINPQWLDLSEWYSPEKLEEMGIPYKIIAHGEDYDRHRLELPWASTTIQGVEGTQPMFVEISRITTDTGDVDAMLKLLTVRGDGTFQLPLQVESIPVGRYRISLAFTNEGYSKTLDDCFTIIVK